MREVIRRRSGFEVDNDPPEEPKLRDTRTAFNELQERLVREAQASTPVLKLKRLIELAGDEAAGLAMSAGFPLLTFPALFNELAAKVRLQQKHQEEVQLRSELMLQEVA